MINIIWSLKNMFFFSFLNFSEFGWISFIANFFKSLFKTQNLILRLLLLLDQFKIANLLSAN